MLWVALEVNFFKGSVKKASQLFNKISIWIECLVPIQFIGYVYFIEIAVPIQSLQRSFDGIQNFRLRKVRVS